MRFSDVYKQKGKEKMEEILDLLEPDVCNLEVLWRFLGHSGDERTLTEKKNSLYQKLKCVVDDHTRIAEREERSISLAISTLLGSIAKLKDLLNVPLSNEMLLELCNLRTAPGESATTPGDGIHRLTFGRARSAAVDNAVQGWSLGDVHRLVLGEHQRLADLSEIRAINVFLLKRLSTALLATNRAHERERFAEVVTSLITSPPPQSELALSSPSHEMANELLRCEGPDLLRSTSNNTFSDRSSKKRHRDEESRFLAVVHNPEDVDLMKCCRVGDLSELRIRQETQSIAKRLQERFEEDRRQITNLVQEIRCLQQQLNVVGEGTCALEACVAANFQVNTPYFSLSEGPGSCVLFPEVRALLDMPSLDDVVKLGIATRRSLHEQVYMRARDHLQEATTVLSDAYRQYFLLTKDPSYRIVPDYEEWIIGATADKSPSPAGPTTSRSTSRTPQKFSSKGSCGVPSDFPQTARIRAVIERASSELTQLQARTKFWLEQISPLLERIKEILSRRHALESAGRDRLLNKKGNMARVLLEEENMRKDITKRLPLLRERLASLKQEWLLTFPGCTLFVDGSEFDPSSWDPVAATTVHEGSLRGPAAQGAQQLMNVTSNSANMSRSREGTVLTGCKSARSSPMPQRRLASVARSISPVPRVVQLQANCSTSTSINTSVNR